MKRLAVMVVVLLSGIAIGRYSATYESENTIRINTQQNISLNMPSEDGRRYTTYELKPYVVTTGTENRFLGDKKSDPNGWSLMFNEGNLKITASEEK